MGDVKLGWVKLPSLPASGLFPEALGLGRLVLGRSTSLAGL